MSWNFFLFFHYFYQLETARINFSRLTQLRSTSSHPLSEYRDRTLNMHVYIPSDADGTVGCTLYSIPPCNKRRSSYKNAMKYIARVQLGKYALS